MMTRLALPLVVLLVLTACLPEPNPAYAPRSVRAEESLLLENFDGVGKWDTYADPHYTVNVADHALRLLLREPGQFLWTSNNQPYDNAIIEAQIRWISDTPTAMAGVVCRLSSARNGTGYYVLISRDGSYSIRYGGTNRDEALVHWQNNRHIPTDATALTLRVICVDDYLALYVNGNYIGGTSDRRLSGGFAALVVGLPPTVSESAAAVQVDAVRIWRGTLDAD